MRIKLLKFRNINSFVGNFSIDFSRFENELFLISGPTGSGKTTIIDAILAALYNKTPRLAYSKHLLNEVSKDGEIELIFWLKGSEYKIKWAAKRKKEDIEIKRALYKDGSLLGDKELNKKIEEILSLSFSDFTKSIVLAQGEFDAFLSANSTQKSQFLEKILDVKEYERISIKIFEENRSLEERLGELKEQIEKIGVNKEELKGLAQKKDESEKSLEKLKKRFDEVDKKDRLLDEKKRLQNKKEELLNAISMLQKEIKSIGFENFKEEFEAKNKEFLKYEKSFNERIKELEEEEKKEIKLKGLKEQKESLQKQLIDIKSDIKELEEAIKKGKRDIEEYEKSLKSIKIYSNRALDSLDEVLKIVTKLRSLRDEYKQKSMQIKRLEEKIEEIDLDAKAKEIRELEKELRYLEAKLLVLKYEEDRKSLKEGEPCPLCGSLEHPYLHSPPVIEEELKEQYEKIKRAVELKREELKKLEVELKTNLNILDEVKKRIEWIKSEGNIKKRELEEFGIREEEFEELKEKKEHNEKEKERINLIQREISSIKSSLKEKNERLEREKKRALEIKEGMKKLEKEIENIDMKIKMPSKEKERLQSEYKEKEESIGALQRSFNEKKEILAKKEALLESKERELKNIFQNLKEIVVEDENFKEQKERLSFDMEQISKIIGQLDEQIKQKKRELERKEELEKKRKSLLKRAKIFKKLNRAIGSRDGKKFKQIALNKMIDNLLFTTNEHLNELSQTRYLLVKSSEDRVDLEIVDRFNQNEKRGVNTLSGGEKFLVSLSLAFGLSDLVRNRVKIDTMFLDEGFGTLDSQVLAKTIEVLKRASKGKSIGIISHVESIKEDINKGIRVKKADASKSILEIV
jgi:exonuclease SbcC